MNLSGIILAGGKSRRFNSDKIAIKIGKIPLFINQIYKLSFFCNEIWVSTNEKNYATVHDEIKKIEDYCKYFDCLEEIKEIPIIRVVLDEDDFENIGLIDIGPIGGIYSGLNNAKNYYSIVLAFDMPFITYDLLKLLALKTTKGFEVLCSLYSKGCLNIIKRNIGKKKYKVSDIFSEVEVKMISENELECYDIDKLNFFNINTGKDYDAFIRLFGEEVLKNDSNNFNNRFCKKWKDFFYRGSCRRTEEEKI
jgi:molybdopterin-guanine dinucleotide biosynthesis protein A